MLDISRLKNKRTLLRLEEYEGQNEYLISLKKRLLKEGTFTISPSVAEYIEKNFHREPLEINRVVGITEYLGEQLKEKYDLNHTPEKILVEVVLGETDKSYHVKGKLYKNQKYSPIFYVPKTQVYENLAEIDIEVEVDFDTYQELDKRGWRVFKHQEDGIKFLLRKKKCILADDMGLGKTIMSVIASIESKAKKVLIVCPANAKINWFREINAYVSEEDISIIKGSEWNPKKYTIINYDILKNFHTIVDGRKNYEEGEVQRQLDNEGFDLIIMDECFTYDTKVKTDIGELSIGDIVENQIDVKILSYNLNTEQLEYKKINRWISKGTNNTLLKIKLPNDIFIECTPNHKIYVKNKGYVKAEEITENDELYYLPKTINQKTNTKGGEILLSPMCEKRYKSERIYDKEYQRNISEKKKNNKMRSLWYRSKSNTKLKTKILFNKLFSKMEDVPEKYYRKNKQNTTKREKVPNIERYEQKISTHSKIILGKNEKRQPNVETRGERENGGKNERKNILKSWWKWKINKTTKNYTRTTGWRKKWVDSRVSHKNKTSKRKFPITTKPLLTRYRKSEFKNSYRNRWQNTQIKKMEIFRQKENRSLKCFRVEGVEVLERRSGREQGDGVRNYTKVYNLEVDDNHNYFANGILVSNCHMTKNPKANRTKIINQISETIERRWLLTGTPIANRPMDYYNLLNLCDSPVTTSWQYYAFRYCDGKKFKKKLKSGQYRDIWITDGASNLEELHDRTKKLILRRKKEDHLDLPPKIVAPYYIELDDMKGYESVFDEYLEWAKSEGKRLGAGRHMVELVVLRKYLAIEKVKQSIELAEQAIENDQKVIIFTNFTHSFNALMKHFGRIAVGHNGAMNATQKQRSIDEFQGNKNIKVFVGNLISAGTAITLTEAEVVIMNDLDFVPANHAQAEDRAWRIGTTSTINVYYPIAIGTIDEMIYEMLQRKRKVIDTIVGDDNVSMDIGDDLVSAIKLTKTSFS